MPEEIPQPATERLAAELLSELPRARRRMRILLVVGIAWMAALLVGALLLMHHMDQANGF